MDGNREPAVPQAEPEPLTLLLQCLRINGVRVGIDDALLARQAVACAQPADLSDLSCVLTTSLISRPEDQDVFDQCFRKCFSSDSRSEVEQLVQAAQGNSNNPLSTGTVEVSQFTLSQDSSQQTPEADSSATYSYLEMLRTKDFEAMTEEELRLVSILLGDVRQFILLQKRVRRYRTVKRGRRLDPRRSLQRTLRYAGEPVRLAWRRRKTRSVPVVVLCDVSGSMARYTKMFLYFLHGLVTGDEPVSAFAFGTRLSNVTRQLRHRDAVEALSRVSNQVVDWGGGTRIASSLHEFNRRWVRRTLSNGGVVLLLTDGLERDTEGSLEQELQRLRLNCSRLCWINPLLRYADYAPLARGAGYIARFADEILSAHNVESLSRIGEWLVETG